MSIKSRRPMTPEEHASYTKLGQVMLLQSLDSFSRERNLGIALHGGLACSLFFNVDRRTSDMDFVVNAAQVPAIGEWIDLGGRDLSAGIQRLCPEVPDFDPMVHVTCRLGDSGKLTRIKTSAAVLPNVIGKIHIHLEFWPVDPAYLAGFERREAALALDSQRSVKVGFVVPKRVAAICDKVLAIIGRPYQSARDFYDLARLVKGSEDIGGFLAQQMSVYTMPPLEEVLTRIDDILNLDEDQWIQEAMMELGPYLGGREMLKLQMNDGNDLRRSLGKVQDILSEIRPDLGSFYERSGQARPAAYDKSYTETADLINIGERTGPLPSP